MPRSRAREPILACMGKTVIHAGGAGNGQAAKICNNMILGISMIGVSEAFALGEKLGLEPSNAVRYRVQIFGPVLVADELLPGARAGSGLAREPRLRGRLHGGHDAKGLEACSRSKPRCGREHAAWGRSRRALWPVCEPRRRRARFFGDLQVPARRYEIRLSLFRHPGTALRHLCHPGSRLRLSGIAKGAGVVTIPDNACGVSGMTKEGAKANTG